MLKPCLKTMRPRQWIKNTFIFAGIIFSQNFDDIFLWAKVLAGFAIFSLLAGCVYIINDIMDVERDRAHPEKKDRPIASGAFPVPAALLTVLSLCPVLLTLAYLLQPDFLLLCLFYFLMNLAYSIKLKHFVILDILVIAVGFVLRAMAGAIIIDVRISPWLLICTLFLALFLALCKRRHELALMEGKAVQTRRVLRMYTLELVDIMISVVTAAALISYSLYTISESGAWRYNAAYMDLTIPFVLFGIFRYLYLVHTKNLGGSPEKIILEDVQMFFTLGLWIIVVCAVLWA